VAVAFLIVGASRREAGASFFLVLNDGTWELEYVRDCSTVIAPNSRRLDLSKYPNSSSKFSKKGIGLGKSER
jgi:hypothetical protein